MDADRIKSWVTFGVVLAMIGVGVFVFHQVSAPHPLAPDLNSGVNTVPTNVMLRLSKPEFTGYDDQNKKSWEVRADRVDLSSDRNRMEAHGHVQAELFDTATGKRRALVNAPFATFSKLTKTLQVGGKIVCRTPGTQTAHDLTVEAETLLWNVGAKQVVCPGIITATLPDNRGNAAGHDLTLDLTDRSWTLKRFHGEFALPANQGAAPPAFANPFKLLH